MPTIQTNCLAQTFLCLCLSLSAFTQPADSIPATRASIFYQSYIGPGAAIYNGIAYQPDYRGIQGFPNFETPNLVTGSLVYEGLTYTHIPLLYDLVKDHLVITDPKGQPLMLATEKVQEFTLGTHIFIYLPVKQTPGFYERLSSGSASLYIRHTKKIEEKMELAQLYKRITAHDEYILFKQDHYYSVTSGKQLLTLLSDKKKELQQFQHAQHIRFKKDPAAAMQAIVDHYNQLPH